MVPAGNKAKCLFSVNHTGKKIHNHNFPAFGLNTGRYRLSLRIQPEFGKKRTRKNPVFGHSRSVRVV